MCVQGSESEMTPRLSPPHFRREFVDRVVEGGPISIHNSIYVLYTYGSGKRNEDCVFFHLEILCLGNYRSLNSTTKGERVSIVCIG